MPSGKRRWLGLSFLLSTFNLLKETGTAGQSPKMGIEERTDGESKNAPGT